MLNKKENNDYVSIDSDGKIFLKVEQGTEGAIFKSWTKKAVGKEPEVTYEKWVLEYDDMDGYITDIGFFDGEFGKLIQLTITDGDDEQILSLSVKNKFGEDLLKKLPAVDLTKRVKFVPYSFEDENKKNRKGVTLYQDEQKIENFYYDKEKGESKNGYPSAGTKEEVAKFDSDDWTTFYNGARKFMIKYIEDNVMDKAKVEKQPEAEINPDDVAF